MLCRLALADGAVDATSFTLLRIISGATMLWCLVTVSVDKNPAPSSSAGWTGTLALFVYCLGFSFAYLHLDAGIGALVLFGTVQITIIGASLWQSEQSPWSVWCGVLVAITGFIYLFLPQDLNGTSVSVPGMLLMMLSGVGWATYTLNGRSSTRPLIDTAFHFKKAIWLCLPLPLLFLHFAPQLSWQGVLLAIASGAVTSGLGYAIWYLVLPGLSRLQAGVIQLTVPLVAALGGIVFIGEAMTFKFIVAAVLVLGGVLITFSPLILTSLSTGKNNTVD